MSYEVRLSFNILKIIVWHSLASWITVHYLVTKGGGVQYGIRAARQGEGAFYFACPGVLFFTQNLKRDVPPDPSPRFATGVLEASYQQTLRQV